MDKVPGFVDMALSSEERKETMPCSTSDAAAPIYPYGLSISLTEVQLAKLDMEDDLEPGDMVTLHCLAKVTSVSKNDTTDGVKSRVEMQITAIESESVEEEEEKPRRINLGKLYSEK